MVKRGAEGGVVGGGFVWPELGMTDRIVSDETVGAIDTTLHVAVTGPTQQEAIIAIIVPALTSLERA